MVGKRHNLEFINILDDNGLINEQGGPFKGQPRFKVWGGGQGVAGCMFWPLNSCA